MNVKEIVSFYLKANGYDGLFGENCGCFANELFAKALCNCNPEKCQPGYKQIITDRENDAYGKDGIGPKKPKKARRAPASSATRRC